MKLKNRFTTLLGISLLFSCSNNGDTIDRYVDVTPTPREIKHGKDIFTLSKSTTFWIDEADSLTNIKEHFLKRIHSGLGFTTEKTNDIANADIRLVIDSTNNISFDGYTLDITKENIVISSSNARGLFYGLQTLWQLLPPSFEKLDNNKISDHISIASVSIKDSPNFKYRGMMLDACRHFQEIEFIKKQLDIMASYKMNQFHWHLTEDQLWTIEIDKYPLLTEIGSKRKEPDGTTHSGYYSKEDIKEIVKYASERYITVIPEIELPGHAMAALTAYPELSCTGGPFEIRNTWGVEDNLYCAGNERVFEFLGNIFDEVVELFPSKYIHIGGDEAPKSIWAKCPKCQKRIKDNNLKNEEELQSWFIHRVENMLLERGKMIIGWDEILEGGLAPSATVMSWQGEKGGIAAASMGHDVIMTPTTWCYLNFGQGSVEVEPITIEYNFPLEKCYAYHPIPEAIPKEKRHHIIGIQGNMWTEYISTPSEVEYYIYPRLLAIAETGWSTPENKNWDSFMNRLDSQLERLENRGVNYHIPMPEGPLSDTIEFINSTSLLFSNNRGYEMIYTLDGSEPNLRSNRYTNPLEIRDNSQLKIATITPWGRVSNIRTILLKSGKYGTPSIEPIKFTCKRAEGHFRDCSELKEATWSTEYPVRDFQDNLKPEDLGALAYEGSFEITNDSVYCFTTEMDELYIGGNMVLQNNGKLIRHSRSRTSIALAKGIHHFKLVMLNDNFGGFPRAWNKKGFHLINHDGELIEINML
ncbi:MAG: beta-N-acetylhexosaminidase [Bacteroidales bacterium]